MMTHVLNQNTPMILRPGNLSEETTSMCMGRIREHEQFKIKARVMKGEGTCTQILGSLPRSNAVTSLHSVGKYPDSCHVGSPPRAPVQGLLERGLERLHDRDRSPEQRLHPIGSLKELHRRLTSLWSTHCGKVLHPFRIVRHLARGLDFSAPGKVDRKKRKIHGLWQTVYNVSKE